MKVIEFYHTSDLKIFQVYEIKLVKEAEVYRYDVRKRSFVKLVH